MTDLHDPLAAVNAVLSEVIDMVQGVKEARWKVSAPDLHAELQALFEDAATWARLLVEQDDKAGVSPIDSMRTGTARTPPNLWPGPATLDGVRDVLDRNLDRLGSHVAEAQSQQQNQEVRDALAEIQRGVSAHRQALSDL